MILQIYELNRREQLLIVSREMATAASDQERAMITSARRSRAILDQLEDQVSLLEILRVLTDLLPENCYLKQLDIRDGSVQLQGEGTGVSDLVRLIEAATIFSNARFASPIARNPRSGLDRFQLVIDLVQE